MPNAKHCKYSGCKKKSTTDKMYKAGLNYFCDRSCAYSHDADKKRSKPTAEPKRKQLKTARPKMTKIRSSAKGKSCDVRIPGVCIGGTETVVCAHLNGGGSGQKSHDILSTRACFACHQWLDGGYVKTHTRAERDLEHLQAIARTIPDYIAEGLIMVKE